MKNSGSLPTPQTLDLSPFARLHTLLGIAALPAAAAAAPLARLPRGLRSLSLTAEHVDGERDFDAGEANEG